MTYSIVYASDVQKAKRFDAEYFKPEYLEIERKFSNEATMSTISEMVICGPFGATILDETYISSGIEVVRPFNIKDGTIEDANLVYISEDHLQKKNLKEFSEGDIFCSRVGDIKVGILTHKRSTISPNIIAIRLDKTCNSPYYVSTFLNTKYGILQLLREQKIVAQPTISTETVRNLKIPLLSQAFQGEIERIVKCAHEAQSQSRHLYKDAEILLLQELGLLGYEPQHRRSFTTTKREVDHAQRCDAEYFQPKYAEIIEKIKGYKGGFCKVNVKFSQNTTLSKKDKDYYNYIEIGDINISNGEVNFNKIQTSSIPANGKIELEKGNLLISKVRPYRGAVGIINFETERLLGSGAFTVLKENSDYKKEVLQVFLRIIKDYLLKFNVGTSYPVIKDKDILNLTIPLIDASIQADIAEKVRESHRLRKHSKDLLHTATRAVELAIEQGENGLINTSHDSKTKTSAQS